MTRATCKVQRCDVPCDGRRKVRRTTWPALRLDRSPGLAYRASTLEEDYEGTLADLGGRGRRWRATGCSAGARARDGTDRGDVEAGCLEVDLQAGTSAEEHHRG